MKAMYRQFSVGFAAGSIGVLQAGFAQFVLPLGVYKVEVWAQGGLTDQSISISTTNSPFYQAYSATAKPVLFAVFNPSNPYSMLSFDTTATTNNASTLTGMIIITPVESV
jgi:hypothetical protein